MQKTACNNYLASHYCAADNEDWNYIPGDLGINSKRGIVGCGDDTAQNQQQLFKNLLFSNLIRLFSLWYLNGRSVRENDVFRREFAIKIGYFLDFTPQRSVQSNQVMVFNLLYPLSMASTESSSFMPYSFFTCVLHRNDGLHCKHRWCSNFF